MPPLNWPGSRWRRSGRERPPDASRRLALGIERLGLASLRHPRAVGVVALVLVALAALGIGRLRVDDSLSQLFRSNTPQFQQYEAESRRFPSSEFDVLVVIEGKSLLQRASIEALRNLATDLQLLDGVRGTVGCCQSSKTSILL